MNGANPAARPTPGDLALAALAALIQVGGTALIARYHPGARALDAPGYLLLAAGPGALVVRRRWPVTVLAAAFGTTLAYQLLGYAGGPVWMALIAAFGTALITGHRVAAYLSLPLGYLCFGWLVDLVRGRPLPSAWAAAGLAAWLLLLVAASELARNRRAVTRARRQRAAEQQRSRHEAERRRASEERLGIARELHDVLGHSLSLINVQAGVALELMDRRPGQARTALTAIKQASKEALVEVESVLDSLRQPGEEAPRAPAPGLGAIGGLVRRAETTGLTVTVERAGDLSGLPANIDAAAYRIVQEALTNVIRHASATTASVRVRRPGDVGMDSAGMDAVGMDSAGMDSADADAVDVVIEDDGTGGRAPRPSGGGTGIRGMRDRAAVLGGGLTAGPKAGGGFRVHARLPLPRPAPLPGQAPPPGQTPPPGQAP